MVFSPTRMPSMTVRRRLNADPVKPASSVTRPFLADVMCDT
jgi:hypothetical protein